MARAPRPAIFSIVCALLAGAGAGCAEPRPVPSKTTPVDDCHLLNIGTGQRYDCDGFTAAFHDEAPDILVNPQRSLDLMVAGLVADLQLLVDRLGAKIRVERSVRKIAGKNVLAARVMVDDSVTPWTTYAAGYAVVAGHRGILCTAEHGAVMERCEPVIRFLVEDRTP